tara:strand:- start:345 stop:473 length:129 start_codon:yes stop_codon:yes gene_type:complete
MTYKLNLTKAAIKDFIVRALRKSISDFKRCDLLIKGAHTWDF